MRRRGFSLLAVLWIVALMGTFMLGSLCIIETVRGRVNAHKMEQQAACMAVSGADYAQVMVRAGRWKAGQHFTSPTFDGGQTFQVSVRTDGGHVKILSVGSSGWMHRTLERTVQP